MKLSNIALLALGFATGSVNAANFSFTGNLANNDEVQPFFFTVTEPNTSITLQTWSNNGGINAAGAVIIGGGFTTEITLFDAISGNKLGHSDTFINPFDSTLMIGLSEGNYIATLTQFPSDPSGSTLSEGFDGVGNFGGNRDSHWALDIINVASASTGVQYSSPIPEPETYAMLLAGLGLLGWRLRRT